MAGEVSLTTHSATDFSSRSGLIPIYFYPGRVASLFASSGTASGALYLQWVEPGNDAYAPGTHARTYIVKYSSIASLSPAISYAAFKAADVAPTAAPVPVTEGNTVTMPVTGLVPGGQYFFAVKAVEADGLTSVLSFGATAYSVLPGCGMVRNVSKSGIFEEYLTIKTALAAVPTSLSTNTCVVIRDTQTYSEQVTVQNIASNNNTLTFMPDPSISSGPVVNPPANSTAAFQLANTSVTIQGIAVIPSNTMAWGVLASSANAVLSNVSVQDPGGLITSGGIQIADYGSIAFTSVTVASPGAFGIGMTGAGGSLSYSSAAAAGASAVYVEGASGASITQSFATDSNGYGLQLQGSTSCVVSQSTFSAAGTGSYALFVNGGLSNSISGSYAQAPTAVEVRGATGTAITSCSLAAVSASGPGLRMSGGSGLQFYSNTVQGSGQFAGAYIAKAMGRIEVSTNTFLAGAEYGVHVASAASGAQVVITSNTVLVPTSASYNTYGIRLDDLASGATVYNNGIYYRTPGSMGSNTSYGFFANASPGSTVHHNRITNPGMVTGGSVVGAYFTGAQSTDFRFNDVNSAGAAGSAYNLMLANSTVTVRDNIFVSSWTAASPRADLALDAASGINSDYNDWFSSNTLTMVWGQTYSGLPAWQATSKDTDSISANPLWYNVAAGVEDFHPLSTAGRYNPATGAFPPICPGAGCDSTDSPSIDAADPSEPLASILGTEPAPAGCMANQGSYGQTSQASKSAPVLAVMLSTQTPAYYDFGSIQMETVQSTVSMSANVFINRGNIAESFQLSAATVAPSSPYMTLGEKADLDTMRLQGLFNSVQPPPTQFDVNASTITGAAQKADALRYAGDQSGYQVAPNVGQCLGSNRNLWLRLTPPTVLLRTQEPNNVQKVRISVLAVQDP